MAKSSKGSCGGCRSKSSSKKSSKFTIPKMTQKWLDAIDRHCHEAHRPRLVSRWEVGHRVANLNTTKCVGTSTGKNKELKPMPSAMIAEMTSFCKDAPTLDAYRRFYEIIRVAPFDLRTTRAQLVKRQLSGGIKVLNDRVQRDNLSTLENYMMNWDWFRCILACSFIKQRIVKIKSRTGPEYKTLKNIELCTDIDRIMMFHAILWYAKNRPEHMSSAFVNDNIGRSKELHDPLTPEKHAHNTTVAADRMITRLLRFETALSRRNDLPISRFHRKALELLADKLFNLASVANRVAVLVENLLHKQFGSETRGSGFVTGLSSHPKSSSPSTSIAKRAVAKSGTRKVHVKNTKTHSKKSKVRISKTKVKAKKTSVRAKKNKSATKRSKTRSNKRKK